jgi:electron transport complex protein RnfD
VKTLAGNQLQMQCSPQQPGPFDTGRLMLWVMGACLPAALVSTWFFGVGLLLNVAQACLYACGLEAGVARLRGLPPRHWLRDNSALVSAVLLGMALPPGSPWWLVLLGTAFAILLAKHAFGGLGQNLFNPAMCGYALLLLSFPLDMTAWHVPGAGAQGEGEFSPLSFQGMLMSLQLAFPALAPGSGATTENFIDGMAMATPLIEQKLAAHSALLAALESGTPVFDRGAQTGWELVNLAYLVGGLVLLGRRVISWHIPLALILSLLLLASLFYSEASMNVVGSPYLHLFGSATMMGAFFIATDPVSAASTPTGKLIYGALIGLGIYAIRVWGSYLDAVAFAVLLGNFCAPLIDRLTVPRHYGQASRSTPWKL